MESDGQSRSEAGVSQGATSVSSYAAWRIDRDHAVSQSLRLAREPSRILRQRPIKACAKQGIDDDVFACKSLREGSHVPLPSFSGRLGIAGLRRRQSFNPNGPAEPGEARGGGIAIAAVVSRPSEDKDRTLREARRHGVSYGLAGSLHEREAWRASFDGCPVRRSHFGHSENFSRMGRRMSQSTPVAASAPRLMSRSSPRSASKTVIEAWPGRNTVTSSIPMS
jgi:hypothetical protein